MLADSSGDDQSLDDIISALCGYGPLMHHSGNQLAAMLVRHVLQANTPICVKRDEIRKQNNMLTVSGERQKGQTT